MFPKKVKTGLNLKKKFDKEERRLLFRKNISKVLEVGIFLDYFGRVNR